MELNQPTRGQEKGLRGECPLRGAGPRRPCWGTGVKPLLCAAAQKKHAPFSNPHGFEKQLAQPQRNRSPCPRLPQGFKQLASPVDFSFVHYFSCCLFFLAPEKEAKRAREGWQTSAHPLPPLSGLSPASPILDLAIVRLLCMGLAGAIWRDVLSLVCRRAAPLYGVAVQLKQAFPFQQASVGGVLVLFTPIHRPFWQSQNCAGCGQAVHNFSF